MIKSLSSSKPGQPGDAHDEVDAWYWASHRVILDVKVSPTRRERREPAGRPLAGPWVSLDGSVSRGLTAVDVKYLARDERSPLEIEDSVDDIADLTYADKGVEGGHALVGRRIVVRGPDDTERNCVNPYPS